MNTIDALHGYLSQDATIKEIINGANLEDEADVIVLHGLTEAEAESLMRESVLSRLKQKIRSVSNAENIRLSTVSGRSYYLPLSLRHMTITNTSYSRPAISQRLMELLDLPQATGVTCCESNRIIAVSRPLAHLCEFQNELDMFGCDSGDGWFPEELERLNRHLNSVEIGTALGDSDEPYEYRAIALTDVLQAMKRGLSKPDAISEARRIDIGATFHRDLFGDRMVRVVTMHNLQFS